MAAPVAALAAGASLIARALLRVEVVGSSMAPALVGGDRLLVLRLPGARQPWPSPGSVIAVRDPRESSRILVKRVASVDRRAGTIEVLGDAEHASTDSRSFGPVGRSAVVGRAVYRYAPAGRTSRGPWPAEYHRS